MNLISLLSDSFHPATTHRRAGRKAAVAQPASPERRSLLVGDAVYISQFKSVAVVYESVGRRVTRPTRRPTEISFILTDGRDIGPYSSEEADDLAQYLGNTWLTYSAKKNDDIEQDYQKGYFKDSLAIAWNLAQQAGLVQ